MAFAPQPEVRTSEKKRKLASLGPRARLPDSPDDAVDAVPCTLSSGDPADAFSVRFMLSG